MQYLLAGKIGVLTVSACCALYWVKAEIIRKEGKHMGADILVPFFIASMFAWIAWVIFSTIRRYSLAKMQSGVQMKLLEKVDSGQALVAYAENVLVAQKNKIEFQDMLRQALRLDINASPENRELNLAVQRRARWLLSRTDKLFPTPRQ